MQLAQAQGYSAGNDVGWNPIKSYHRASFEDRTRLHSRSSYLELLREYIRAFSETDRSRLIIRTLFSGERQELLDLTEQVSSTGGTLSFYPHRGERSFWYLTFSLNRSDRALSSVEKRQHTARNLHYIHTLRRTDTDFESFALDRLDSFHAHGYELTSHMQPSELAELWNTFGWSAEACQKDAIDAKNGNFVIGVRDRSKELIAAILYSHQPHRLEDGTEIEHGELTEACTKPTHRGHQLMSTLATSLHVMAILRGTRTVYGEYRTIGTSGEHPIQSLRFALESGADFETADSMHGYLYNHVDIGGTPVDDMNTDRTISGYDGDPTMLRSFLLGSMHPDRFTPKILDTYQAAITS